MNTVTGPPADFPLRVLYSCVPPGHKQVLPTQLGQHETYGRKKAT